LLLAMLDARLPDPEWREVSGILESYLVRRAVCELGTKNYNRIFLSATRTLRKEGFSAAGLKKLLLAQTGESSVWPDDALFHESWLHQPLYGPLNSPKLVHIYLRLNEKFMSKKNETVVAKDGLTIEHIMPREWAPNWPLPDGSKGMNFAELIAAKENDPRLPGTRARERALHTLGNLTVLTSGLNTAQSNLPWDQKWPEMMKHSLLPINQNLWNLDRWDEVTILARGEKLFANAVEIWPR
jgi:hypothetical protein